MRQRSLQNGRQGFSGENGDGVPHCGQGAFLAGLAAAVTLPQRLQKVSSKPTSQSAVLARVSSPFCARKRMLRTYLLALISGTQGRPGSSRTRNICAVLPPSICWKVPGAARNPGALLDGHQPVVLAQVLADAPGHGKQRRRSLLDVAQYAGEGLFGNIGVVAERQQHLLLALEFLQQVGLEVGAARDLQD